MKCLKPLEERINTQYQLFYQKLEHQLTKSTLLKGKAKCKKPLLQLLFSDYWIYPALPALFALSAAVQIFYNRSPSKESLLKINVTPHIADIKIADTRVIYKELIDLTKKLGTDISRSAQESCVSYHSFAACYQNEYLQTSFLA